MTIREDKQREVREARKKARQEAIELSYVELIKKIEEKFVAVSGQIQLARVNNEETNYFDEGRQVVLRDLLELIKKNGRDIQTAVEEADKAVR